LDGTLILVVQPFLIAGKSNPEESLFSGKVAATNPTRKGVFAVKWKFITICCSEPYYDLLCRIFHNSKFFQQEILFSSIFAFLDGPLIWQKLEGWLRLDPVKHLIQEQLERLQLNYMQRKFLCYR
jgi:hypothetical protein